MIPLELVLTSCPELLVVTCHSYAFRESAPHFISLERLSTYCAHKQNLHTKHNQCFPKIITLRLLNITLKPLKNDEVCLLFSHSHSNKDPTFHKGVIDNAEFVSLSPNPKICLGSTSTTWFCYLLRLSSSKTGLQPIEKHKVCSDLCLCLHKTDRECQCQKDNNNNKICLPSILQVQGRKHQSQEPNQKSRPFKWIYRQ
jgi:hypothetical protein